MLSLLPSCRELATRLRFKVSITLSTGNTLSQSSDIYLLKSDIKPLLKIIDIYPQDFNCLTGSKYDITLLIEHAEAMKNPSFSYSVSDSQKIGLITCELDTSLSEENMIKDYYLCKLKIYNSSVSSCDVSTIKLYIFAKENEKEINTSTELNVISEVPSISITANPSVTVAECQVQDLDYTCIPKEPSQTFFVELYSNIEGIELSPENIRLTINGEESGIPPYCEKENNGIICEFILPAGTEGDTITYDVYADVYYMNYHETATSQFSVKLKGDRGIVDSIINRTAKLEKERRDLNKALNGIMKWISRLNTLSDILCCCNLVPKLVDLFKNFGSRWGSLTSQWKGLLIKALIHLFPILGVGGRNDVMVFINLIMLLGTNSARCLSELMDYLYSEEINKFKEADDYFKAHKTLEGFDRRFPCDNAVEEGDILGTLTCLPNKYPGKYIWCKLQGILANFICPAVLSCFNLDWRSILCLIALNTGIGALNCLTEPPAGCKGTAPCSKRCLTCYASMGTYGLVTALRAIPLTAGAVKAANKAVCIYFAISAPYTVCLFLMGIPCIGSALLAVMDALFQANPCPPLHTGIFVSCPPIPPFYFPQTTYITYEEMTDNFLSCLCKFIDWIVRYISGILNMYATYLSFKMVKLTLQAAHQQLNQTQELFALQEKGMLSMMEYQKNMVRFFNETLPAGLQSSFNIDQYLTTPYLALNKTSGEPIMYMQDVCKGDEILISYDVMRMNVTLQENPVLQVISERRGPITELTLTSYQGSLHYIAKDLFKLPLPPTPTNPDLADNITFVLSYGIGSVDYMIHYNNETERCLI